MKVTEIQAHSFKGRTFSERLADVTLFHGPNFAGKSARLEALQVALGGYAPGVAKRPTDVFHAFASGPVMRVCAHFDGGEAARVYDGRSGSVKYQSTAPELVPPVALGVAEFLGMTGPERVRFLFELAGGVELKGAELVALRTRIVEAAFAEDPGKDCADEAARFTIEMADAEGGEFKLDMQWLVTVYNGAADVKREHDRTVKRLEGLIGAALPPVDQAPPDSEDRLRSARERLSLKEREVAALQERFNKANDMLAEYERSSARLYELREAEKALAESVKVEPPDTAAEYAAADLAFRKADARLQDAEKAERVASRKANETFVALKRAKESEPCPTCGHKMKADEKELKRLTDEAANAMLDKNKAVEAYNAAADAENEASNALHAVAERTRVRTRWLTGRSDLTTRIERLRKWAGAELVGADRDKLQGDAVEALNKLEDAKAEVPELVEEVSKWDVQAKRLLASKAEADQRARAREEKQRAMGQSLAMRGAMKALKAEQAESVRRMVGPILARANALCSDALGAELALGPDADEFCLVRGGKLVPVRRPTCSGSEEAMAAMALGVALAAGSRCRISFLDELNHLDDENKVALVATLCKLVQADELDQAVLTDVRPLGTRRKLPGFKEVEVEP